MFPPEPNRGHTGMNFEGSRKMLNDAKATFDGNRLARQFGIAEQVFGTRNSRLIQKFVQWNPGVLLKQLGQVGPRNSHVGGYFIESPRFTEPGFQQMNGPEHCGMPRDAGTTIQRLSNSTHYVENEHVQRESKRCALMVQGNGCFLEHPSKTAFKVVSVIDREDRRKLSKDVPVRMASGYRSEIEPDTEDMRRFAGSMFVPMIDVRTNTVNRTRFQNKLAPAHGIMMAESGHLVVKLPMPVEMGPYSAPVRVPDIAAIDNVRNQPIHFGGPEPRDHSVLVKQFHP
jgi:hypothetical protein